MELAFLIVAILYVVVRAADLGIVVAFRILDRDEKAATIKWYEATVQREERISQTQDVISKQEERELVRLMYENQLHQARKQKKYSDEETNE